MNILRSVLSLPFLALLQKSPEADLSVRILPVAWAAVLNLLLLTQAGAAQATERADIIFYGGQVLTVDNDFRIRSVLVIKGEKIAAVGDESLLEKYDAPKKIDLKGRTLMPGFMDTHVHLAPLVLSKRDIDAEKARSIKDLQRMLKAKSKELGPDEWITGQGWDEALFKERRNPLRWDLDVVPNPVVLVRAGGHSVVGNSAAIKIAGLTPQTPDPHGGLIEKTEDGKLNGIIRESQSIYTKYIPRDNWVDMRGAYIQALKHLVSLGFTSIMEASGSINDEPVGKGGIENPPVGPTYKRLRSIYDEVGDVLPRVALYISYPGAERLKAYPHKTGYGDDRVRIAAIGENPVDGGFTGPTAWTLADYKGRPGFRGKGRFTDAELQDMVDTAARLDWQVGLHAIGDAAIVQTVDAYSKAIRRIVGQKSDHRWFLDHFTVMPPDETMETMAKDGIMIAQQPGFTYNLEGRYEDTLDEWRLSHNNSIATPAHKFGLLVAFGTDDLPVDPRVGLYAAVTRRGMSGRVHGPQEAVSIAEAIRMYTANGPHLTWEEKIKGTLEPGKLADMIVLDSDPLTIPSEKLLTMKVDMTVIGGKIVYEREE